MYRTVIKRSLILVEQKAYRSKANTAAYRDNKIIREKLSENHEVARPSAASTLKPNATERGQLVERRLIGSPWQANRINLMRLWNLRAFSLSRSRLDLGHRVMHVTIVPRETSHGTLEKSSTRSLRFCPITSQVLLVDCRR